MSKHILIAAAALALAAACSPPTADAPSAEIPAASSPVDPTIEALVRAHQPDLTITGGVRDEADGAYEVAGVLPSGEEIKFALRQSNGVWTVTQIQKDIAWADAPEPVRAAYAAGPDALTPARVIESTDPVDGAVYYQLFSASDQAGFPSAQVRWYEGEAAVMPPAH